MLMSPVMKWLLVGIALATLAMVAGMSPWWWLLVPGLPALGFVLTTASIFLHLITRGL